MKTKTAFVLLSATFAAAAVGCGGSDSQGPSIGTARASLHRAKNCGDLLSDLKADAKFKLTNAINRQIADIQRCIGLYGDAQCASYGGIYYADGGARSADMGAPTASPSAPASQESASDGKASSYSETNTQVAGVDEADIVKTDGSSLFVLHGRAFKVLKAWPAQELAESSSLDIEGQPSEMFVADGKVVVYSTVNGAAIFQAAGVTPKTTYRDYYYYPGGWGGGLAEPAIAPYPTNGEPYAPLTKVTVLALGDGGPQVAREMYFEGGYLDSRRVGSHVRTVLSGFAHGPKLVYSVYELYAPKTADGTTTTTAPQYPQTGSATIQALQTLHAQNDAIIAASTLGDWLPYTFVKEAAGVSAKTIACEDFYVPTVGSTESGITEVASIDLADPAPLPRETAILGRADTVYGNSETLYLAAHAWIEPPSFFFDNGTTSSTGSVPPSSGTTEAQPAEAPAPSSGMGTASLRPKTTVLAPTVTPWSTNKTHLHKFDFTGDPGFPNYAASGTVAGSVKDQFSLDHKDGFLRVATTESRIYVDSQNRWVAPVPNDETGTSPLPSSLSHVFVLGQNGDFLEVAGKSPDLAPNERIFSVRFVESRGYVVTFRQVDPLFVLDLANPKDPRVLAALKIPGFSEYMHPLDANHILTIGRDASTTGGTRGLQLQIFDVSDGAHPVLAHKFTYTGDEYGSSEAEYDHKAFTYFADRNLLAFPYFSYGYSSTTGTTTMRSTLELFRVDLGSGFSKLGAVDHSAFMSSDPTGYCGGYYRPSVRRGVFLENFVYSISYGGVIVSDATNLTANLKTLALSAPIANDGYGVSCY